MSKSVTRLFQQFQPENYQLTIALDKKKLTFAGTVTITGKKVGRPSQRITFHQKDLKVTSATITKHDKRGDADIPVARINLHNSFDEVRLHADGLVYPGNYTVTLEFSGTITENLQGLYPSHFKIDGEDDIILGTQFESHYAREVFPCIDEPEAKATFDVIVTAGKDDVILGNTPVTSEDLQGSSKTVTFEQTPLMSTYLLAFVAGNMEYKEATTKDGVVIRVYATPDKVDEVDFSLGVAVKVLEFYNNYFKIPYPLPKLDMVALPDFSMGAMENWGLVTYREQALLVNPKNTSLPSKQWAAMVVAHELAHQWFGNLVTMRWWNDLWLNEGFASWIEYMAVDHIFPEWDMWTQYVAEEQQAALRLDALENTHPIEVAINHPDEIRIIFDTISYAKGSSVIHMLHDYLGPQDFQTGLQHYLKTHAYKNTETTDLWQALSEKSGKDVSAFMHNWTAEPGFPVVTLQDGIATQERFYLVPPKKVATTRWQVPLLAEPQQKTAVLEDQGAAVESGALLNAGRSGFFRVAYDVESSKAIDAKLADGSLQPTDRLGLLSDIFEVVKAGYGDTVAALQLLARYADEENAAVWDIMTMAIGDVRTVMAQDDETRDAMKPFIAKLIKKQLVRLGWEPKKNESHFDTLLRPPILGLASFAEIPEVIKEIKKRHAATKKPTDVPADLRSVIWNTIARQGGEKEFDQFLSWHNDSTSGELRVTLSAALTGFTDPKLTKRALDLMKTKEIRKQDAAYWLAYAFMNRHGRDTAWQWLQDNWDWWEKSLGTDLSFSRTPIYVARVFTGEKQLQSFKKFFEPKMNPTMERSIKQGIEIITWHTNWHNREHQAVFEFLKKN
jgi:puromycin-sensitive aminopeptidase